MTKTWWLIITRASARCVKRRPAPEPGQWIVELRVDFPQMLPPRLVELELQADADLAALDVLEDVPEPEPSEP